MKTCVHLVSLPIDSMIRVGGDYQAQIPEFKPGKFGEKKSTRETEMKVRTKAGEQRGGREPAIKVMRNIDEDD